MGQPHQSGPQSPDVSVIVAAYNTEDYIGKAIRSALSQEGVTLEVIVVDDCSTDETRRVVRSIEDSRVRLLCNETNRGPSYSRNRAIKAATGDWISILDSDDWFADGRLKRLIGAAKRREISIVADDILVYEEANQTVKGTHFDKMGASIESPLVVDAERFVRTNRPGFPCMRLGVMKPLIRRRLFEGNKISYNNEVRFAEDFQLYVRLLVNGARMLVLPKPGYYRRRREGSIVSSDKIDLLEHDIEMSRKFIEHPDLDDAPRVRKALYDRLSLVKNHLTFCRLRKCVREEKFYIPKIISLNWVRIINFVFWKVYSKITKNV
jgi:succinoglycan biosynthesis protein ExoO